VVDQQWNVERQAKVRRPATAAEAGRGYTRDTRVEVKGVITAQAGVPRHELKQNAARASASCAVLTYARRQSFSTATLQMAATVVARRSVKSVSTSRCRRTSRRRRKMVQAASSRACATAVVRMTGERQHAGGGGAGCTRLRHQ